MQTTPTIEPIGSPSAGAIPDAAPSPSRRRPVRNPYARLLSVLRGDKYTLNAYPPAWPRGAGVAEEHHPEDATAAPARADRRSNE
jgi:hypothetical protein